MDEQIFISDNIDVNISNIKKLSLGSFDVIVREFKTVDGVRMCVVFVDALVNKITVQDNIIRPCVEAKYRYKIANIANIKNVLMDLLSACDVKEEPYLSTAVSNVMFGETILLMRKARGRSCIYRKIPSLHYAQK